MSAFSIFVVKHNERVFIDSICDNKSCILLHFSLIVEILFFSLLEITHSFDGKAQHIQREGWRRQDDDDRHARFIPFIRAREERLRA